MSCVKKLQRNACNKNPANNIQINNEMFELNPGVKNDFLFSINFISLTTGTLKFYLVGLLGFLSYYFGQFLLH